MTFEYIFMNDQVKKAISEQEDLISECKRGIEGTKLEIWSFKADLSMLEQQFSLYTEKAEVQESEYYSLVHESRESQKQAKLICETLNKFQFANLLRIPNPSLAAQDIAAGICVLLGHLSDSWSWFRKLLKQFEETHTAMKTLSLQSFDKDRLEFVGKVIKKHSIALMVRDAKFPDELQGFANWMLHAYRYADKETQAEALVKDIPETIKDVSNCYLEIQEIKENIDFAETQLSKYIECIEVATNNICKLRSGDDDIDFLIDECKKLGIVTRKQMNKENALTGIQEINGKEESAPSLLVESLYMSFSQEVKVPVSDPPVPEDKLANTQRSTAPEKPNSDREIVKPKKPSKKRCCGLVA